MKLFTLRNNWIDRLFFVFFAIFLVLTLFHANQSWVTSVLSLPLVFMYPGYYLSRFWRNTLPAASRFSYSIVFSVALHLALLTALRSQLPLNSGTLAHYLLMANLIVGIIYWFFFREKQKPDTLGYEQWDYIIVALPFLFFLINFAISPLISEGDSYYFIYAALDSFKAGHDVSPYINRPGFIPFLGLLHLGSGEGFVFIFRFLLPALFYFSALPLLDHIKEYSKNYRFSRALYLLLLAAPVLTTEVDIARTQSLVFFFTIPVLVLLSQFLTERRLMNLIIAVVLSVIGTRIHELSYVLLLTCGVTAALYGLRHFLQLANRKKAWMQLGKALVIIALIAYPYFALLSKDASFAFVRNSSSTILLTLLHPHWTWWFLSSYTTDGWQLGWSGVQALLYYLYNGILLLLAGAILLVATRKKIHWSLVMPPLIFSTVYFLVAEIFPRINLFYYPNRAWPHLMIGCTVLIIALTTEIHWRTRWLKMLTALALGGAIIAGLIGWTRLTYDKGGFYMKQEVSIRNFIRDQLPANAILYVTQSSNQAIIGVYGNKQSIYIPYQTTFTRPDTLWDTITVSEREQEKAVKSGNVPYRQRTIIENESGGVISEVVQTLPPTVITIPEPTTPDGPLYFYYSFARFNGYMGQRDWWKQVNSIQNYNFFKQFPDKNVVYRDDAGIIIKLK